ncbi:TetR/AcrR family transcriptional regulator [Nocardioides sp. S-58]|uniref:TetR/AcrR family transcriptional regulator n=1 Tax=Nocardioides renjunii TaxID=3095075 RepID=A0ABU5K6T8_9ACTN|nr:MULTISPECIES: TetR/AcrR family transcriptional regulator [unclassified Nocardioides]MDZ5660689.1 TetR/AcrR family transcriptional regulator [Nocardioides sp. S-58]WQQ21692.1 TetR/AcrR family transcriptional regulator [Nocardioides sp. S-34]
MSRSAGGYHHGNLQAALEDAALDLLETTSAAKISLREVARRAGVSHNAPYHHFGDRAALLGALGVRGMAALLAAQEEAVAGVDGTVARVRALGLAYVRYAASHPQAFSLVFDPDYCAADEPSAEMAPLIRRNEELLGGLVGELVREPGYEGRDPLALSAALWSTVHGMAQLIMLGHLPLEAAEPALQALVQ